MNPYLMGLLIAAYVVFGCGYMTGKTQPSNWIENLICLLVACFWPVAFVARLGWLLEKYTDK